MKVYISADMEGTVGLSAFHQVNPKHPEFQNTRRAWTLDINELVQGALDGGADEVLVNESHDGMNYLVTDLLHPQASFLSGRLKPKNQMQCVDEGFDIAFIMTHAMAGAQGVMSHSFVCPDFYEMRLNGQPIGELGLNILMASQFDVPMGLVVGDDTTCREARALVPDIECVVTKQCITQMTARCNPTGLVRAAMRESAAKAVANAANYSIYRLKAPYELSVSFTVPAMCELISYIPGVQLADPRTAVYRCDDYLELTKIRILMVNLARAVSGTMFG